MFFRRKSVRSTTTTSTSTTSNISKLRHMYIPSDTKGIELIVPDTNTSFVVPTDNVKIHLSTISTLLSIAPKIPQGPHGAILPLPLPAQPLLLPAPIPAYQALFSYLHNPSVKTLRQRIDKLSTATSDLGGDGTSYERDGFLHPKTLTLLIQTWFVARLLGCQAVESAVQTIIAGAKTDVYATVLDTMRGWHDTVCRSDEERFELVMKAAGECKPNGKSDRNVPPLKRGDSKMVIKTTGTALFPISEDATLF